VFKYPNPLALEVRGVKTFKGMEGGGYNATVYAAGKKVAELIDDATGGPLMVHVVDTLAGKEFKADLKALCASLPPCMEFGEPLPISIDIYLDELVQFAEIQRKLARVRIKATPFRLVTDAAHIGYRTINTPDVGKARAYLDAKFPNGYVLL